MILAPQPPPARSRRRQTAAGAALPRHPRPPHEQHPPAVLFVGSSSLVSSESSSWNAASMPRSMANCKGDGLLVANLMGPAQDQDVPPVLDIRGHQRLALHVLEPRFEVVFIVIVCAGLFLRQPSAFDQIQPEPVDVLVLTGAAAEIGDPDLRAVSIGRRSQQCAIRGEHLAVQRSWLIPARARNGRSSAARIRSGCAPPHQH